MNVRWQKAKQQQEVPKVLEIQIRPNKVLLCLCRGLRKPAFNNSNSHPCGIHTDGPDTGCTDRLHDRSMHARDHTTLEQKMINACGEASNVVVQPGAELPSCRKADRSITAFLTFDCVETLEIACAFPCCREATSAKIPLPQRSDRVHRFRFVPSVYF